MPSRTGGSSCAGSGAGRRSRLRCAAEVCAERSFCPRATPLRRAAANAHTIRAGALRSENCDRSARPDFKQENRIDDTAAAPLAKGRSRFYRASSAAKRKRLFLCAPSAFRRRSAAVFVCAPFARKARQPCFGMFAEAEGNAPPFFMLPFCPARRHNGRAAQIYIVTEYAGAAFDKLSFFSAQKDKF